ncbi:MAG TPA: sigma-70 family RNA polymerase sigma factor [Streptosporangiaceae bacterium]|jgi:DNA-directed RNA polymerase specialized sigma24 family protein
MKDPLLVDALRARDPGAPAALYDTHGEGLFRYCWFLLRSRDAAQVALRDTLVIAEAHIGELHSPSMLRPWLYALARAECERRQESPGATHDSVIARPDQPDADRRLIAWHAVMSLDAIEREGLELAIRHGMDVTTAGLVLGLEPDELRAVLDRGRAHLELALAGEILARHGVHKCAERAAALKGWAGELTTRLCERLVDHAKACEVCRRYLPRNVSALKVYGLLPVPTPPQSMRLRVMTCFTDPELVGYRMFVAARMSGFDQFGFPDEAAAPAASVRGGSSSRFWTSAPAVAAVAVAVMIGAVFAISWLGGFATPVLRMSQASPGGQSAGPLPATSPQPTTGGASGSAPGARAGSHASHSSAPAVGNPQGSAVPTRLYQRATPAPSGSPSPSQSTGPTGPPVGSLAVSPSQLALGPQSTAQITLTATGAAVTWTAAATSSAISLSSDGGTVTPGSPVSITVSISRAASQSGQGTITFSPAGSVSVSWTSTATSPPPPPVTPTPTVVRSSPTPTPPSTPPSTSPEPTPSTSPTPVGSGSPSPTPTPASS